MSARRQAHRRKDRSGLYAALAAVGVVVILLVTVVLVVVVNSDDGAPESVAGTSFAAADAIPNLEDLGYELDQVDRDPAVSPDNDMARARYSKPGTERREVLLRIYYTGSPEEAFELYTKVTQAYAVMPIQVLVNADPTESLDGLPGGPANVILDESPPAGDSRQSFQTTRPDSSGNAVWTDVYLDGNAVVAVQVLDSAESDSLPTRATIAERIMAALPQ